MYSGNSLTRAFTVTFYFHGKDHKLDILRKYNKDNMATGDANYDLTSLHAMSTG